LGAGANVQVKEGFLRLVNSFLRIAPPEQVVSKDGNPHRMIIGRRGVGGSSFQGNCKGLLWSHSKAQGLPPCSGLKSSRMSDKSLAYLIGERIQWVLGLA